MPDLVKHLGYMIASQISSMKYRWMKNMKWKTTRTASIFLVLLAFWNEVIILQAIRILDLIATLSFELIKINLR